MKTVFIYTLNDPITGLVRYVGKTKNVSHRFRNHLYRARQGRNHRVCWIRSLLAQGLKPVFVIVDEVSEIEWPSWEVAYIEFFRECGCDLVNANQGGEGGICPSEETRRKMSRAHLGKRQSEATRLKIGLASANRVVSLETRARMSVVKSGKNHPMFGRCGELHPWFGKKHSEEARRKISEALSGRSRCKSFG